MQTENQNGESKDPPRLNDFEVLEKIGDGPTGAVYRSRHIPSGRIVALKILAPELAADAEFVQTFLRESEAAMRLEHPNLVAIHGVGEAEGHYFCATELVIGQTLSQWVRREGACPETTVLGISICVANALKHAWDKAQLLHGDVTPHNIFLDAEGNVKLADLGQGKSSGAAARLLAANAETAKYLSPEQRSGQRAADPSGDIYSLGMTIYCALTGGIPLDAGAPSGAPQQLPDPREAVEDISPHICRVLEKMLAKEPSDRYQTWEELLRDLELARDGKAPQLPLIFQGTSTMRRLLVKPQPKGPVIGLSEPPTKAIAERARPLLEEELPEKKPSSLLKAIVPAVVLLALGAAAFYYYQHKHPAPPPPPPPPPPQITPAEMATKKLDAIKEFIDNHPTDYDQIIERLENFIKEFPESLLVNEAQQMLEEVKAHRKQAIAEAEIMRRAALARQEQEAQRRAELQALERSERIFGEFVATFLKALSRREYEKAAQLTQQATTGPAAKHFQKQFAEAGAVAQRLKKFWETFPTELGRLKGRIFKLRAFTGRIAAITDSEISIEIAGKGIVGIAFADLTLEEVLMLADALSTTANKEMLLNLAWFCFAEGDPDQASERLETAKKAGADATSAAEMMKLLLEAKNENDAKIALEQLRELVSTRQWSEAKAKLNLLRSAYEHTKTVQSAADELARTNELLAQPAITPAPEPHATHAPAATVTAPQPQGPAVKIPLAPTSLDAFGVGLRQKDAMTVEVYMVRSGSPASKIGLKARDIIVNINGHPIAKVSEVSELISKQQNYRTLGITVLRNGEPLSLPRPAGGEE